MAGPRSSQVLAVLWHLVCKNPESLIKQPSNLLKQSVNIISYVNYIYSLLYCDIIINTIENNWWYYGNKIRMIGKKLGKFGRKTGKFLSIIGSSLITLDILWKHKLEQNFQDLCKPHSWKMVLNQNFHLNKIYMPGWLLLTFIIEMICFLMFNGLNGSYHEIN